MKFAAATPLYVILTLSIVHEIAARAADNGKYSKVKYTHGNHGKYVHTSEGDYVEDVDRYRYVHVDDGHRGRYFHVHIPYDGGYGNYEGGHEPFRNPPYDASGLYAFVQKPRNESCLRLLEEYSNACSDINTENPFKTSEYDIKKPTVYFEYGTPYPDFNYGASSHQEKKTSAAAPLDPRVSNFPGIAYLPAFKDKPERKTSFSDKAPALIATKKIDTSSTSATTTGGQESKIDLVTAAPEMQPSITLAPKTPMQSSTTPSTAAMFSTTPMSTEQQLHHCRAELEAALQKLSHKEPVKRE